jgi:hypothetical protein
MKVEILQMFCCLCRRDVEQNVERVGLSLQKEKSRCLILCHRGWCMS